MNVYKPFFLTLFLFACLVLTGTPEPGYRIDFSQARQCGKAVTGWIYRGKPGTVGSRFSVEKVDGKKVLVMRSRKGTGTLLYDLSKVDLKKYPYMRWKWRVDVYPVGADGRHPGKDDQAVALYLGAGTPLFQHSCAFRWDTVTPKGSTGFVKYGLGTVKVYWTCLRNSTDGTGVWRIDECNAREVFRKMCKGKVPAERALTLSANSQYTGTSSRACLEYVEFYAEPLNYKKEKGKKK
jgi:hypothetical protein